MGFYDVHAHLTSPRFSEDVSDVIERAKQAGVSTIISNGLNVADNEHVLTLAQQFDVVKPAIGYYPVDAVLHEMVNAGIDYPREDVCDHTAEETIEWIGRHTSRAIAIGEIGLDHHWVPEQFWKRQEDIFRKLVDVAMEAGLPVIIHSRKAEARAFDVLVEMKASRVNWHCFSSRLNLARRISGAGHYLSIPANARRSETFTGLLSSVNREKLLLETDCPYLSPKQGTRNEPANVVGTVAYASEVWKVTPREAQAQFEENFECLFGVAP